MKPIRSLVALLIISGGALAAGDSDATADLNLLETERLVVDVTNEQTRSAALQRRFRVTATSRECDVPALLDQLPKGFNVETGDGDRFTLGYTAHGPAVRFPLGEIKVQTKSDRPPMGGCGSRATQSTATAGCGSGAVATATASTPAKGAGCCGPTEAKPAAKPTAPTTTKKACGCGSGSATGGNAPLAYQATLADIAQTKQWAELALRVDQRELKVGQRTPVTITASMKSRCGAPMGYLLTVPDQVDGAEIDVITGPEDARERTVKSRTLFQGEVPEAGSMVTFRLGVTPTHASALRLEKLLQFATRLPQPLGGPASLKTDLDVERTASSVAIYVGSAQFEVSP